MNVPTMVCQRCRTRRSVGDFPRDRLVPTMRKRVCWTCRAAPRLAAPPPAIARPDAKVVAKARAKKRGRRKAVARGPCSVYMVRHGPRVKVGITVDPRKRIRGIETAIGMPVEVLAVVEFPARQVASQVEGALLRRFGAHRLEGEWLDTAACDDWPALLERQAA